MGCDDSDIWSLMLKLNLRLRKLQETWSFKEKKGSHCVVIRLLLLSWPQPDLEMRLATSLPLRATVIVIDSVSAPSPYVITPGLKVVLKNSWKYKDYRDCTWRLYKKFATRKVSPKYIENGVVINEQSLPKYLSAMINETFSRSFSVQFDNWAVNFNPGVITANDCITRLIVSCNDNNGFGQTMNACAPHRNKSEIGAQAG